MVFNTPLRAKMKGQNISQERRDQPVLHDNWLSVHFGRSETPLYETRLCV